MERFVVDRVAASQRSASALGTVEGPLGREWSEKHDGEKEAVGKQKLGLTYV